MRSDKKAMMIELITSWIIKAFSAFAPKWEPAELGTARMGRQTGIIQSFLLQNFFPTSENFFSFLPLPTDYCILPTASLGASAQTQAFVRATPGSARAGIGFVRAVPGSARGSQASARIA